MKIETKRRTPRRLRAFVVVLGLMLGMIVGVAGTASATGDYPDSDAVSCGSSAWCKNGVWYSSRGYAYRNCTDYVAWKLQSLGVSDTKTRGLGNGGEWAARANGRAGVTVNGTPAYGAAAVIPSSSSNQYGHVAFVESVNSNGTITISEYNYGWNGSYHARTATAAAMGFTQFVHFGVSGGGGGAPNRTMLLNPGSHIYAKDSLSGGGWLDQGTAAPAIDAGSSRMALINSANQVFAKDNVTSVGGWLDQGAAAKKVVVGFGGRMYIITPDNWVYGKDDINSVGGWLNQNAQAIDVAIGLDRVAIVTPCGAVYAKNNLDVGGWIQQSACYTATDVEVSSTGRIAFIRTDGAVFAKDNIDGLGGWLDQNATAAQLKLGANRLLILAPDSHVYAKDHLGAGGWINQGPTAVQVAISDQGRLVLRNSANQVYAKDDINPGGWLDQGAVAIVIAA